jgi:hypothetical protein
MLRPRIGGQQWRSRVSGLRLGRRRCRGADAGRRQCATHEIASRIGAHNLLPFRPYLVAQKPTNRSGESREEFISSHG